MAEVYRVRREGPGGFEKTVVLKVVREHLLDDPKFPKLFMREARLAAQIDHPNVVQVHELFEESDILALAMEYVDGASLATVARNARNGARVATPLAIRIVADAALGLQAAHDATGADGESLGIVHRDVSPHNILVSRAGHTKVCDFGVAKASEGTVTGSGSLKGKFAYMSPEQANMVELDHRSDVYSLAVVLWELLANRRLYSGKSDVELLRSSQRGNVPELDDEIPLAIRKTLSRALQTKPARRTSSAAEFRRELFAACPEARALEPKDIGAFVAAVPTKVRRPRRQVHPKDPTPTMSVTLSEAGQLEKKKNRWLLPMIALGVVVVALVAYRFGQREESADVAQESTPQSAPEETVVTAPAAPVTPAVDEVIAPSPMTTTLMARTEAVEEVSPRVRRRQGMRRRAAERSPTVSAPEPPPTTTAMSRTSMLVDHDGELPLVFIE